MQIGTQQWARRKARPAAPPLARFLVWLCAISLTLNPAYLAAQNAQDDASEAGRVIMVRGQVAATDANGQTRPLGRRDAIYVGDTIFTDLDSRAQFRMVDGAQVALQAETEFAIVAYDYDQSPATDNATLDLIQGGFRTITGNISRDNREAYQSSAGNFATIGIRGTDYEVVMTPAGEVLTGVYDGGITVTNNGGSLDLGVGADFDFARVPDASTPPQGMLLQPSGLGDTETVILTEPESDESQDNDEATDETDNDGDDGGDTDAGGNAANGGNDNTGSTVAAADGGNDDANDAPGVAGVDNTIANTVADNNATQAQNQQAVNNANLQLDQPSGEEIAAARVEISRPVFLQNNGNDDSSSENTEANSIDPRINPTESALTADAFTSSQPPRNDNTPPENPANE
ncbi:MAG: FecR domain-containing protein, partial [Pseudohongiellaceae bacterium]